MTRDSQTDIPVADELRRSRLFRGLTDEALAGLMHRARVKNVQRGQVLVEQGAPPTHLFFILAGSVKTTRLDAGGKESVMRLVGPSETFMDAVIFMRGASPIGAEALEESRLLLIPAEDLHRGLDGGDQLASNILYIVAEHYRDTMTRLEFMQDRSPKERVGFYLLMRHLEQNPSGPVIVDGKALRIQLPHRKSVIASYLGMKPETFSRALQDLQQDGLQVNGNELVLGSWSTLCQFCAADLRHRCAVQDCPLECEAATRSSKAV